MFRVLIVDDHVVVRKGLRQVLSGLGEEISVGEAATGSEALRQVRTASWDVVMLDISMPDIDGMTVLRELRRTHPHLPVLLLSAYADKDFAVTGLKEGASGFLSKDCSAEQLLEAIDRARRGGRYASPLAITQLVAYQQNRTHAAHDAQLSARERQILSLIATGVSLTKIAASLSLSVKTIATYRARLLHKLGLKSNAELIRYALQNDLVHAG